ncbi:hypothetical protein QJQ45_006761 [Haematococcus lacustris]|nr:hypothetical protein QJQ45_006761 [Haematococcus lacustris]
MAKGAFIHVAKLCPQLQRNYFDTYKVVVNRRQSANETYVLYQCGTQPPPPSAVPAGAKFFSVPLSSVSVDETTVVAFMKLLGVSNRITFTSRFAVDACQQSIGFYGCQQLAPGNPAPSASNVNATLAVRAIANKVDAFFTYGNTANNMTISVTASADPGVLNRAEWIKYVATFFNVEDKANNIFTQVAQSYASTKAAVANVVASLPATQQPIVAWLYYSPANPAWGPVFGREVVQVQLSKYRYQLTQVCCAVLSPVLTIALLFCLVCTLPAMEALPSDDEVLFYMPQDAGGVMISPAAFAPFVDSTNVVDTTVAGLGNINLYNFTTMGQVLRSALANVTWVIDETRYPDVRNQDLTLNNFVSTFGFSAADLASLPFLRDGKIVRVDKESNPDGYTSWYEMAVARPDQVLMDLANLFHPTALASNAAPTFLRSLTAGQVTLASAAQCPLINCQAPVTPICPLVFSQGGRKAEAVRVGFPKVVQQPSRPITDDRPDRLVIVDEFRPVCSGLFARAEKKESLNIISADPAQPSPAPPRPAQQHQQAATAGQQHLQAAAAGQQHQQAVAAGQQHQQAAAAGQQHLQAAAAGQQHQQAAAAGQQHQQVAAAGQQHLQAAAAGQQSLEAAAAGKQHLQAAAAGQQHQQAEASGQQHLQAAAAGQQHQQAAGAGQQHLQAAAAGQKHLLAAAAGQQHLQAAGQQNLEAATVSQQHLQIGTPTKGSQQLPLLKGLLSFGKGPGCNKPGDISQCSSSRPSSNSEGAKPVHLPY